MSRTPARLVINQMAADGAKPNGVEKPLVRPRYIE